jgi:hypothetical protein
MKNKLIDNIKWFFTEIMNIYSNKESFFSKKRIESGIGFIIAEWGMIFFLVKKIDVLDAYGFGLWASIQFFIAGYIIKQIQKEKSDNQNISDISTSDSSNETTNTDGTSTDVQK